MRLPRISDIKSDVNLYLDTIPKNTAKVAAINFLVLSVISTAITGHLLTGLIRGSIAATATLIQGAVTPIFSKLFDRNGKPFTYFQDLIRSSAAVVITAAVTRTFGFRINIIQNIAFNALLLSLTSNRPVDGAKPVFV